MIWLEISDWASEINVWKNYKLQYLLRSRLMIRSAITCIEHTLKLKITNPAEYYRAISICSQQWCTQIWPTSETIWKLIKTKIQQTRTNNELQYVRWLCNSSTGRSSSRRLDQIKNSSPAEDRRWVEESGGPTHINALRGHDSSKDEETYLRERESRLWMTYIREQDDSLFLFVSLC